MKRTVIDIFSKGNQELFHSAFLAWLMDANGEHGMGDSFLRDLVRLVNETSGARYVVQSPYRVATEHRISRGRLDIIVLPEAGTAASTRGLVFENKTKAFGQVSQLDAYAAEGFDVCCVALVPETLSRDARAKYPLITYGQVRECIRTWKLEPSNHYHFLIDEYARFIEFESEALGALRRYVTGEGSPDDLRASWREVFAERRYADNDVRTLTYFYYHLLIERIEASESDLVLGEQGYNEHGANTRWIAEKNMQGPPYLEAILARPQSDSGRFVLGADFARYFGGLDVAIAPRLEIWLDPLSVIERKDSELGCMMLGGWGPELRRALSEDPQLSQRFKRRGSRNFHYERIGVDDLVLGKMVERIRAALAMIGDVKEPASRAGS